MNTASGVLPLRRVATVWSTYGFCRVSTATSFCPRIARDRRPAVSSGISRGIQAQASSSWVREVGLADHPTSTHSGRSAS